MGEAAAVLVVVDQHARRAGPLTELRQRDLAAEPPVHVERVAGQLAEAGDGQVAK
jgi:hypothetical protein